MTWLSALKIFITSIISIASASGIIIAIAKWLAQKISYHIEQKLLAQNQLKMDKILAEYQALLDKKAHISTVHFDTEFGVYKELSSVFFEMISAVHWLFPAGLDRAPATGNWENICQERYKTAQEKYNVAVTMLGSNALFIREDNYSLFHDVLTLCARQIHTYAFSMPLNKECCSSSVEVIKEEGYKRTETIDKEWNSLLQKLRKYFETLQHEDEN